MIQFYFLSIILNLLGGLALCDGLLTHPSETVGHVKAVLGNRAVRATLGVLSIATGIMKLLYALRGDIPVLGDFLPATMGLAVGASILADLRILADARKPSAGAQAGRPGFLESAEAFFERRKAIVGMAGILAGITHFVFPTVLFL